MQDNLLLLDSKTIFTTAIYYMVYICSSLNWKFCTKSNVQHASLYQFLKNNRTDHGQMEIIDTA